MQKCLMKSSLLKNQARLANIPCRN